MPEYLFKASLPDESLKIEASETGLNVEVIALVEGAEIPMICPKTNDYLRAEDGSVKTLKITVPLMESAPKYFDKGIYNVDHKPDTMIGPLDSIAYNDKKLITKGSINNPVWIERIKTNNYSGVSVEGKTIGDFPQVDAIQLTAVSFLGEKEPACSKDKCSTKIEAANPDVEGKWSPNYDAFWSYIEEDGKINMTRANEIFLTHEGSGENRGDWKYPTAIMSDGKPKQDSEGLMAAFKRAAQQGETGLYSKLRSRMRSIGMEIPPGLKASAEEVEVKASSAQNDNSITITTSIVDIDGTVITEKEFVFELKGEKMVDQPEVPAQAEVPAAPVVATPATPVIEPAVLKPVDPWTVIKSEIGIGSKDEFEAMKSNASKYTSASERLNFLEGFYRDSQKKFIQENFPPAVWDGEVEENGAKVKLLDKAVDEYLTSPQNFNMKYLADAIKFAAAKAGGSEMRGSAVENPEIQKPENKKTELQEKTDRAKMLFRNMGIL